MATRGEGPARKRSSGKQVRVTDSTHITLSRLTRSLGQPMQAVIERAVEDLRRRVFLEEAARSYSALRRDRAASAAYEAEVAAFEGATVADGLD